MKIERDFELEKETKNTLRYTEVTEGQPPVIGTVYIQKWVLKSTPKTIRMTLSIDEE